MAHFYTRRLCHRVEILQPLFAARYAHSAARHISKKVKFLKLDDEKESPKPLCVILGWGGSKQKNLERYSEIFTSRGFSTITVTPSLADILLFPDTKGKKIGMQILQLIKQEFSERNSVFFQFSNAGCGLYHLMCKEIYDSASPYHNQTKIVGSIFDSCPVVPSKESIILMQKAFTMNIMNPIVKNLVWYSLGAIAPIILLFNSTVHIFMDSLRDSPVSAPHLFMYSKSDALAPYKDISTFIEYRQSKGIDITKMLWEETPHVSHLKHDPATYSKVLNEFLDKLDV